MSGRLLRLDVPLKALTSTETDSFGVDARCRKFVDAGDACFANIEIAGVET
jgi:hypothetical protein